MTTCARCGRDIPSAVAVCPYCGERNAAADAGSGAYQLIGDEVLAPAAMTHNGPAPFGVPAFSAAASGNAVDWDDDWPASPAHSQLDEQQPQPQTGGLLGGHLTLYSSTTSGSLSDGGQYEYELSGGEIIVGRSPGCDISLPDDPLASRRHAVLSFKEPTSTYTIADLGSSNGTYLNGVEVTDETELHDGDVITVGRHTLAVSATPGEANALPIDSRVTGPLALLPSEDTDPHVSAVSAADESEAVADVAPLTAAPWAAEVQPISLNAADSPVVLDSSRDDSVLAKAEPDTATAEMPVGAQHQHNLDALQSQLVELIGGLRQQAEADAEEQQRLRQALADVRDTLETALATQLEPGAQVFTARVDMLADLARKTAENPRHLDYVLSLSERAEELVVVLEAVQKLQAGGGPLAPLQSLYARVTREVE